MENGKDRDYRDEDKTDNIRLKALRKLVRVFKKNANKEQGNDPKEATIVSSDDFPILRQMLLHSLENLKLFGQALGKDKAVQACHAQRTFAASPRSFTLEKTHAHSQN